MTKSESYSEKHFFFHFTDKNYHLRHFSETFIFRIPRYVLFKSILMLKYFSQLNTWRFTKFHFITNKKK